MMIFRAPLKNRLPPSFGEFLIIILAFLVISRPLIANLVPYFAGLAFQLCSLLIVSKMHRPLN